MESVSVGPISAVVGLRDDGAQCWCCDASDAPDRMVQLGRHPEVHVCLPCAYLVYQRAWEIEDGDTRGFGEFARDQVRNLRAEVTRRGWHHNRFIGSRLRWLDEYLP